MVKARSTKKKKNKKPRFGRTPAVITVEDIRKLKESVKNRKKAKKKKKR